MSTLLGDKIRDLRKAKGYTLDKLAELAESSKSYIWELENKNPPRPSADKIAKIAAVLGVTADYLIDPTETVKVEDATEKFIEIMKREAERLERNRDDFMGMFSEADLNYLIERWSMKDGFCRAGDMKWGIYQASRPA